MSQPQPQPFILPSISELTRWKTIGKFSEIDVKPNTLILCDIDDTLLHHPAINNSWIMLIHHFFYIQSMKTFGMHDKHLAYSAAERYIEDIFRDIPIRHTDREGFFSMLEKATDFAFVTARLPETRNFTYSNLKSIDISPRRYPVHFCGNIAKGEYINMYFDLSKYDYVIFIDDQERNLDNVMSIVYHPTLELYKFEFKLEMSPFEYYPLPPGFNPKLKFDGNVLIDVEVDEDNIIEG
jgi:hypothetical protein